MPPRPNSQSEPSSRRAILKSSKSAVSSGAAAGSASSNPARRRQARHIPFSPNDSPQTEQEVVDAVPITTDTLVLDQNSQQLAELVIDLRFRLHRPPDLGPKHLAVSGPQTRNMTADG